MLFRPALHRPLILDDPLADLVVPFMSTLTKAAARVETLGTLVVAVRPEAGSHEPALLCLRKNGVDKPPPDALAPPIRRNLDQRNKAVTRDRRSVPVLCPFLHSERHP